MYYFRNDYSEGALPQVLEALCRTNDCSTVGYGTDAYCQEAAAAVQTAFSCPDADVHFLVGGTQTNQTAISAFLRPWEAVIAAESAHIATHETGAIEATGHKVCTVPSSDGKLTPEGIRRVFEAHACGKDEHMVLPKLVYLSDSTELGTIYRRAELDDIAKVCRELGLYLYLDGARLAQALTCPGNNIQPEDLSRCCDAFYVGGTKNGLLFGEALVIARNSLKANFRHAIKQHGGMLAKGRLLGVQFSAYLENGLWLEAASHANAMAAQLTRGLKEMGYTFLVESPTNQVFVILPAAKADALEPMFHYEFWKTLDDGRKVVRLVTSWATKQEAVDAFLTAVRP